MDTKNFKNERKIEANAEMLHRWKNKLFGPVKKENETINNNQKTTKMSNKTRNLGMYSSDEFTQIVRIQDSMLSISAMIANLHGTQKTDKVYDKLVSVMEHLSVSLEETLVTTTDGQQEIKFKSETKVIAPAPAPVQTVKKEDVKAPLVTKKEEKKNVKVVETTTSSSTKTEANVPSTQATQAAQAEPTEKYTKELILAANSLVEEEIVSIFKAKGKVEKIDRKPLVELLKEHYPKDHEINKNNAAAWQKVNDMITVVIAEEQANNPKEETTKEPVVVTPEKEVAETEVVETETVEVETVETETVEIDEEAVMQAMQAMQAMQEETNSNQSVATVPKLSNETTTINWSEIKDEVFATEDIKGIEDITKKYISIVGDNNTDRYNFKQNLLKFTKEKRNSIGGEEGVKLYGQNKQIEKDIATAMKAVAKAS